MIATELQIQTLLNVCYENLGHSIRTWTNRINIKTNDTWVYTYDITWLIISFRYITRKIQFSVVIRPEENIQKVERKIWFATHLWTKIKNENLNL